MDMPFAEHYIWGFYLWKKQNCSESSNYIFFLPFNHRYQNSSLSHHLLLKIHIFIHCLALSASIKNSNCWHVSISESPGTVLVQGRMSASFVQRSLTPIFAVTITTSFVSKSQALQADLPWWTLRQIHPFVRKKAIYLVIVNCNYLFLDDICRIFFRFPPLGLQFHCGFIYSIIARPVSVEFCTLLILMRCTAHLLCFLRKRVSINRALKWSCRFLILFLLGRNICPG